MKYTVTGYPSFYISYCGDYWILKNEITVTVFLNKKKYTIVIPDGFVTDFASFNNFALLIMGDKAKYNLASLVHDYLYSTFIYSKSICDKIFKKMLQDDGVNIVKRNIMYVGVCFFGDNYFQKNKENIHKNCKYINKCEVNYFIKK